MAQYVQLADLKTALGVASTDTADDAFLTTCAVRASDLIDNHLRTIRAGFVSFVASTGVTRYYSGDGGRLLITDDIAEITALHERDAGNSSWATTWTTADYWTPDRQPWNLLEVADSSTAQTVWTRGRRNFRIAGTYGLSTSATAPTDVQQATIEEAARMFKARDAQYGDAIGVDAELNAGGGGGGVVMTRALSARTKLALDKYRQTIIV